MAKTVIEFPTHAIRAVIYDDADCIHDIIESDDAYVLAEALHTRGWYGTGVPILYKDVELGQGELSLAEEIEAIRG